MINSTHLVFVKRRKNDVSVLYIINIELLLIEYVNIYNFNEPLKQSAKDLIRELQQIRFR